MSIAARQALFLNDGLISPLDKPNAVRAHIPACRLNLELVPARRQLLASLFIQEAAVFRLEKSLSSLFAQERKNDLDLCVGFLASSFRFRILN
jgi:hypothetical protein